MEDNAQNNLAKKTQVTASGIADASANKGITNDDRQRADIRSALDAILNFGPNDPVTKVAADGIRNALKTIQTALAANSFPEVLLAKAFPGRNEVSNFNKILDNAIKSCDSVAGVNAKTADMYGPLKKQLTDLRIALEVLKQI